MIWQGKFDKTEAYRNQKKGLDLFWVSQKKMSMHILATEPNNARSNKKRGQACLNLLIDQYVLYPFHRNACIAFSPAGEGYIFAQIYEK